MKHLILKKQSKGYYCNKVDSIEVIVSICSSGWEGTITDENAHEYIVYKVFCSTKKEVTQELIKFISYNL